MATLVLTAVGTVIGGPIGGAIGSFVGKAIDGAVFGTPGREGPRLKELAVTTSSYGTPLARLYGTVRAPGSVIWATDLAEHKEKSGGGKGKPKITTYSYSMSFAVALASRPILGIGRIWADGNLLRGAGGDLKVGGAFRCHAGEEDQVTDPLIAADIGASCPAFRGLAYVVFEDLQLADFGNRMPALTFEVFADATNPTLATILDCEPDVATGIALPGLAGLTYDGGNEADLLAAIDTFYPLACDGSAGELVIISGQPDSNSDVVDLPPPVTAGDDDFGRRTGTNRRRSAKTAATAVNLRYYDTDRDFQPGLQRSRGRPGTGMTDTLEFPASLSADNARRLANGIAARRESGRETMSYRMATLDPAVVPGAFVRPVGDRNVWRVVSTEWRATGLELELAAISPELSIGLAAPGDAGQARAPNDIADGPTVLAAFELPWDGTGSGAERQIYAAVSSPEPGWTGAALYVDRGDGILIAAGYANRDRATIGTCLSALPPATPHLYDRASILIVDLLDENFTLSGTDMAGLTLGTNTARVGREMIQFAEATALGGGQWRLEGLLRGRGGTEFALDGHVVGEEFVLLDETLSAIDPALVGSGPAPEVVALGNLDVDPVTAPIADIGATLRPLEPVKGAITAQTDGSRLVTWTRRARGGWTWLDEVDAPLSEPSEAYEIRAIDGSGDQLVWEATQPQLTIDAAQWGTLIAKPAPRRLEIRQVGTASLSRPLTLAF